jgi:hypothetical protein
MHTKCQNPDAFHDCSAARGYDRDGDRFCAIDCRERGDCPRWEKEHEHENEKSPTTNDEL